MKHYTLLTTFPQNRGSANVGDQLIEISLKKLIAREIGQATFTTIFREEPLEDYLDEINRSDAVLMPGFAIRDTPLYPKCYRLTESLDSIRVPLIPVGANWNVYPGDAISQQKICYSNDTATFLQRVARNVSLFSCREKTLPPILERHGIANTIMTGDPAWYDPAYFGREMKQPRQINKLVYSPPLSPYYLDQGKAVLQLLAEMYPQAEKICSMHLADLHRNPFSDKRPTNDASMSQTVALKNARIRAFAAEQGFHIYEASGDVRNLEIYKECDLHVGYECHAHISFLRWRIPSVLIAEDARGVGFNATFGYGGFNGFIRATDEDMNAIEVGGTSGYCMTAEEYAVAPCNPDLPVQLRTFLQKEQQEAFQEYGAIARFIDETYAKRMAPFLRSLA